MCQLLGMNCNTPTDIVFSFTGFATRGGQTDEHKDGWGIAFFEGKGVRHFVDHQPAISSPIAQLIKQYPIKSKNVIAHIRKATQGEVMLENCHPFVREYWGQQWVFAHNGDLKEFYPTLDGHFHPVGTTDSERAFCFLMQELARAFPHQAKDEQPSIEELQAVLQGLTKQIATFGTFNMLLSNGQALFVHCSTRLHYVERRFPFTTATLSDDDLAVDFAQVTTPQDKVAVIVTEPLTNNENWHAFAPGEFRHFVEGSAMPAIGLKPCS